MSDQKTEIYVPDHILDMIPECANCYVKKSKERLLAHINDDQHETIFASSTHHITGTSERRELHRSILQETARSITPKSLSEKPTLIYVCGPPAVGKSTLLKYFDARITNGCTESFQNPFLEDAFQCYATAKKHYMAVDFELFKRRLPEFEQSGKEFTIIRAEASALDQAIQAWAKELKTNIVLEQIDDCDLKQWVSEKMEDYKLISIAVTASPALNAQRLEERNQKTGQVISIKELDSYIERVSASGMNALRDLVDEAYLFSSEDDGYKAVYVYKNGKKIMEDSKALAVFESYTCQPSSDLVVANAPKKNGKPKP